MYILYQIKRGRAKKIMTGTLKACKSRQRQLKLSQMRGVGGEKVTYRIELQNE